MEFYDEYFTQITSSVKSIDHELLESAVKTLIETSRAHGKIIIAGNGGSDAMASHVSVDLTKNAGVRSVNFNESDLITCFANDYGYKDWIAKAIEFYADSNDCAILISSSGSSLNILSGALEAKQMGLRVITFSGFSPDNPLRESGDLNFWVESDQYSVVEMTHQIWLLSIVDRIIEKQII